MEKLDIINKAISEADLLYVEGELVKPYSLENGNLFYLNLSTMENETQDISLLKVSQYEQ